MFFPVRLLVLLVALAASVGAATVSPPAAASSRDIPGKGRIKLHKIWRGQTLGAIAKRYRVTIAALATANGIRRTHPIKPGEWLVVPPRADKEGEETAKRRNDVLGDRPGVEGATAPKARQRGSKKRRARSRRRSSGGDYKVHKVYKGHTLKAISRRYHIAIDAICHANDIERTEPLQIGQRLIIPHKSDEDGSEARKARKKVLGKQDERVAARRARAKKRAQRRNARRSWRHFMRRARRPGYVRLEYKGRHYKGYVIGRGRRVLPLARQKLEKVLGTAHLKHGLPNRLLKLLTKASDTFGGRKLRIVSGYRTRSYSSHSRHRQGHAIDFSIPGVPNEALRDYLLTFDKVGVGYYPNSSFVHFDVRAHKTYWVDLSGPGEAPRYAYKGRGKPKK